VAAEVGHFELAYDYFAAAALLLAFFTSAG
jgi:hypothetical protein